ncbi:MAG TPA: riboflavin synthase [bacterium]
MFTGIIREVGTVARLATRGGVVRMELDAPKTAALVQPLDSVAVHGVCLTAVASGGGRLACEMIPETRRRTSLGACRVGSPVHLEPSLGVTDRFHGHLVFGHVDGAGTVTGRRRSAGEVALTIRAPREIRPLLVPKGPIAVDGVSLTVGAVLGRGTFTVHLIPETLRRTALGHLQPGDRVNLEADYFAKLIRQLLRR